MDMTNVLKPGQDATSLVGPWYTTMCAPSSEENPLEAREEMKKIGSRKSSSINILLGTFDRSHMDPSMEAKTPKVQWDKKINIWMPPSKLILVNVANLHLRLAEFSRIDGILT